MLRSLVAECTLVCQFQNQHHSKRVSDLPLDLVAHITTVITEFLVFLLCSR